MNNIQIVFPFRLRNSSKVHNVSILKLATTSIILCLLLSFTTSIWNSPSLTHFSIPSAKAASSLIRRINIPYFTTDVPFNQTAIFWFGYVDGSNNYIDVRMGYNNSEVYIDLHVIDQYVWYDTNAQAPDLTNFDTATIDIHTAGYGSNAPDSSSYKFVAQVDHTQSRTNYQRAYRGNGSSWNVASLPFTTVSGWRGHGLNGLQDSGWTMTYHLPFAAFGYSGSPPQGTVWQLGIKVHNQDDAQKTPLPEKWWPESFNDLIPSSWGELAFGLPTYHPPQITNKTNYMVRNKLNNQVVTDGMVGGALGCGNQGLNRWPQLGGQSYPAAKQVTVENEWDISDWNCFSKWYITFPLSSLPKGKGVSAAAVTLYLYSNAGIPGKPNPSLIQVATVNEDWNPQTLAWNNAPLVKENISRIVVNTRSGNLVWPGVPYTWDVSKAVADAYASGQPLRLVFYSTDSGYSTGKYFSSSYTDDWNATARPTLQATLGNIVPTSKSTTTTNASKVKTLSTETILSHSVQSGGSSSHTPPRNNGFNQPAIIMPATLAAILVGLIAGNIFFLRKRRRKEALDMAIESATTEAIQAVEDSASIESVSN